LIADYGNDGQVSHIETHTKQLDHRSFVISFSILSRPLRVLSQVLMEIRTRLFDPIDARSGRLAKVSNFEAFKEALLSESLGFEHVQDEKATAKDVEDTAEGAGAKPFSEEALGAVGSEHATSDSETDSEMETTVKPRVTIKQIIFSIGFTMYQRPNLMQEDNHVVFICGRNTGVNYSTP